MQRLPVSFLSLAVAVSLAGNALAQNDDCTGAIAVVQGANGPFTNVGSTTSVPAWPCALGGNDVWYSYLALGSGSLTADLCGSSYDTSLEIFDGTAGCGAIVSLGCNDDSCGLQSSLTVPVTAGMTYYIRVGGFNSSTGTFTLNINGPVPGQVTATATNYGTGCVDRASASVYETFAASTFDLSNTTIMMVPGGNGYVLLPGTSTWYTPTGATLPLTDDSVSVAQPLGFTLSYPGGSTTDVYVSSNGFVWAQPNTGNGCCNGTPATLIGDAARWCPLWNDLNPTIGGTVQFDTDPINGAAYVTFTGVPEYSQAANLNTFQVAFFSSGMVEYRYQSCTVTNHTVLTGWTPGFTQDPGMVDLSTALPLTTQPDINALSLVASARPIAGNVIGLDTSNVTATAPFGAIGLGLFNPAFDLTGLGMPGCTQYTDNMVTLLFLPFGAPTVSTPFAVTSDPAALGVHFLAQAFVYDPAAGLTPLGAIASNGVDLGIGNF
jgi:hypothetical protein